MREDDDSALSTVLAPCPPLWEDQGYNNSQTVLIALKKGQRRPKLLNTVVNKTILLLEQHVSACCLHQSHDGLTSRKFDHLSKTSNPRLKL